MPTEVKKVAAAGVSAIGQTLGAVVNRITGVIPTSAGETGAEAQAKADSKPPAKGSDTKSEKKGNA